MDRRHGKEGQYGIGGGNRVTEESERNLNIAHSLAQRGKPAEALPYIRKAMKDRRNIDADIELAFVAPTKNHTVQILEDAEARGRSILLKEWVGPTAFDDDGPHVGRFWDMLETRPYMRVLQALVRMYFETGRYAKSTKTQIEMLRLCPGDNMAVRKGLGSALIRDKRYADALSFAQMWLNDDSGSIPLRGGTTFQAPKETVYPPEKEATLMQYCTGELIHTAALASFLLYGDCPQSQQYLRIASKTNPHILLRVLGKIRRPDQLNMFPRLANGPEEAHDYLWLTQDLWMEDAVWNWADNNPDAKRVILKNCSRPGCRAREGDVAQFKRCAACRLVSYCGPDCQKMHWKDHKAACKEHQALKAASKALMKGKPISNELGTIATADINSDGVTMGFPARKKEGSDI